MRNRTTADIVASAARVAAATGAATIAAVGFTVGLRAWRFTPDTAGAGAVEEAEGPDYVPAIEAGLAEAAAANLAELVRFRTVSSRNPLEVKLAEFDGFIGALRRLYPRVHAGLELERVNGHALLFRWPGTASVPGTDRGPGPGGSQQSPAPRPVVLMAHYDVVPVDEADGWTHPPFSGHNDGTYLWGRGTLDDKGELVVILEAVEALLAEGFRPAQDIYLSFGDNEETAGDSAAAAVDLLRSRGVQPWMVLDEGGAVVEGAFPGVGGPSAVVGIAEKGILDVQLLTRDPGGHASTPPRMGATARLARAVMRLENNPFPASLPAPTVEMVQTFGRHTSLPLRLVFANLWLLKVPLTRLFGVLGNETSAMTRTTVAITELEGSKGANVLAATARANANIRIAVGETVAGTVGRLRRIIRDPLVELTVVEGNEPSPVSPTDNEQFALLRRAIGVVYPEAIVSPYVMLGGTDGRRFTAICDAVYRFAPFRMSAQARASIHAVNERVLISTLGQGVRFYQELIRSIR